MKGFKETMYSAYTENNNISPEYFDKYSVKRGLRNPDGTGVMAGVTNICNVHGYVVDDGEKKPAEGKLIFRGYQSKYTHPDESLKAFYNEIKSRCTGTVSDRAESFCDILSDTIEYCKCVTDTSTTAAQAFAMKKGVCQDFSHILISLLRMDGIAARYIAGLAFCDGETHSWVEYWTGDHWEGIDPANNCPVSDDYLVISQGRDFRDCAIDRGVMFGKYTRQLQLVRSVLT